MSSERDYALAHRLASVIGENVILGCRPDGRWFAHARGCEYDGSTPYEALKAVHDNIARLLRDEVRKYDDRHREAQTALTNLVG